MTTFQVSAEVYSPRLGYCDSYTITFEPSRLQVRNDGTGFFSVCTFPDRGDPEWSKGGPFEEPLLSVFSRDDNYPPHIIPLALECAWKSWRNKKVDDETLTEQLRVLFAWIDTTARTKPVSDFWDSIF